MTDTCHTNREAAQLEANRMNASRDAGDPFYEVFRVGEYFIVDYRRSLFDMIQSDGFVIAEFK